MDTTANTNANTGDMRIDIQAAGPYMVSGGVPLLRVKIVTNDQGESVGFAETARYEMGTCYALCRCGQSRNKPFCDGSHQQAGFTGTETASHSEYQEHAEALPGADITLFDNVQYCIGARFCERADSVWALTEESDDPQKRALACEEACLCPSGRLVMYLEEQGLLDEPDLEPSIALIEDPANDASSALWVRGGIPLYGADGQQYPPRNRVTLCRCGQSHNKPFCDGSHYHANFTDGHQSE